jgi:S-adenosylmethionine:diacylglycerol 3-amino-3-carboxypropyl transferase
LNTSSECNIGLFDKKPTITKETMVIDGVEFEVIKTKGTLGTSIDLAGRKTSKVRGRAVNPYYTIRNSSLKKLVLLDRHFKKNNISIMRYGKAFCIALIMRALKCNKRSALDYYSTLLMLSFHI